MIEECMENIAFYENQKQLTLMQSSESHPISQLSKPAVHRKQKPDVYELYRKVFCSIKEQVKRIDMPDRQTHPKREMNTLEHLAVRTQSESASTLTTLTR